MLKVKKNRAAAPEVAAKLQVVGKACGPDYVDKKIDALVTGFEKNLMAMSVEAVAEVRGYNKRVALAPGDDSKRAHVFISGGSPVLCVATYAKLQWELLKFLAQHKVEPNRRIEKLIIDRREKLLDYLDWWERRPLWQAYKSATTEAAKRKCFGAHQKLEQDQRRIRLGLTQAAFARLCKEQLAQYRAAQAESGATYATEKPELVVLGKQATAGLRLC